MHSMQPKNLVLVKTNRQNKTQATKHWFSCLLQYLARKCQPSFDSNTDRKKHINYGAKMMQYALVAEDSDEIQCNSSNVPSYSCSTAVVLTALGIIHCFQINVFVICDNCHRMHTTICLNEFPCITQQRTIYIQEFGLSGK